MNPARKKRIEAALPPYLIFAMQLRMAGLGHPQTPGIQHTFATAARDAVALAPVLEQQSIQAEVVSIVRDMTRDLRPRDPRDALLACFGFMMTVAENGLYRALSSPLPSLARQEMEDYARLGLWAVDEPWIKSTTVLLLMRARFSGLFLAEFR